MKETFISRSKNFIETSSTFDRLTMNKSEVFNLSVIKHEFWNRVYKLKPVTKEDSESRNIVRNVIKSLFRLFGSKDFYLTLLLSCLLLSLMQFQELL